MTTASPFDDDSVENLVLVNGEGQHSLWPAFVDVPSGWTVVYDRASRRACLSYVEENWTDMRPASLVREMNDGSPGKQ